MMDISWIMDISWTSWMGDWEKVFMGALTVIWLIMTISYFFSPYFFRFCAHLDAVLRRERPLHYINPYLRLILGCPNSRRLVEVRALVDTGSRASYVSEGVVFKLNAQVHRVANRSPFKKCVYLWISDPAPEVNPSLMYVGVYVLEHREHIVAGDYWDLPPNMPADVRLSDEGDLDLPVDMVIGQDLYTSIFGPHNLPNTQIVIAPNHSAHVYVPSLFGHTVLGYELLGYHPRQQNSFELCISELAHYHFFSIHLPFPSVITKSRILRRWHIYILSWLYYFYCQRPSIGQCWESFEVIYPIWRLICWTGEQVCLIFARTQRVMKRAWQVTTFDDYNTGFAQLARNYSTDPYLAGLVTHDPGRIRTIFAPILQVNLAIGLTGRYIQVNCLLDSGSNVSYISPALVEQCQLTPLLVRPFTFAKFISSRRFVCEAVHVHIRSPHMPQNWEIVNLYIDYSFKPTPVSQPLTEQMNQMIEQHQLRIEHDYNPTHYEIIIGQDLLHIFMDADANMPQRLPIEGTNAMFVNTKFGHVVIGPTDNWIDYWC